MKLDIQSPREVLPLASNNPILPHVPTRVVSNPADRPLMLERLVVAWHYSDWIINDIEIDGTSQLEVKNLPGTLFSSRGVVTNGGHASSMLRFRDLDVIETGSEVAVTVTYIGLKPHGELFYAAIVGGSPPQRQTALPIETKNKLLPTIAATITAMLDRPLEIDTLEIENTGTDGGAADWIVNDIRIDETSLFKCGDVPGDLFAVNTIDNFIKFPPGARIELVVTYIGSNEMGCRFTAHLLGTVVRDNLQQPPPDVRAIVRTSGEAPDEEVLARCNWRAPYVKSGI